MSSCTPWLRKERQVQFLALHTDEIPEGNMWPSFGSKHPYWKRASGFVKMTANTVILRSGNFIYIFFKVRPICTMGYCI